MAKDPNKLVNRQLKKTTRRKTVRSDPDKEAVLSKLIKDPAIKVDRQGRLSNASSANAMSIIHGLRKINQSIADERSNYRDLIQLFPDIELAIQILVSSIISPKDMTQSNLYYTSDTDLLPPEVQAGILAEFKSHIEKHYKISSSLSTVIRDVLFESGSYAEVIIPEAVLGDLFTSATGVGLESEVLNTRVRNSGRQIGLESDQYFDFVSNEKETRPDKGKTLEVISNPAVLLGPTMNKAKKSSELLEELGFSIGMEADGPVDEVDRLFAEVTTKKFFTRLRTEDMVDGVSTGRPVVIKVPSESIFPVFIPGKPDKHIGYFVLIDSNGNPVTEQVDMTQLQKARIIDYTKDRSSASEVRRRIGIKSNKSKVDGNVVESFKVIVEEHIRNLVARSISDDTVKLDGPDYIYEVMLARVLKGQGTRLLYVPAEMVSYIAHRYHPNGVGKTMTEDIMLLASMRAMILFTKLMAMTKNSIAITEIDIKLDENDPDPEATIEKITSTIMTTRQSYLPVGVLNPADLTDWVHRAGIEFKFSGHPGLPDVEINTDHKKPGHELPEEDLDEELKKSIIMHFGLNPEMVDNAFSPEFATTVISQNILMSKRVRRIQEVFEQCLNDKVFKLAIFDKELQKKLREYIRENISAIRKRISKELGRDAVKDKSKEDLVELMVKLFVQSVTVSFPNTDETDLENLSEAFGNYKDALEDAIESVISEEAIPSDLAGDISDYMDTVKDVVKHYYLRKWMAENNFLPELADIVSFSPDGEPKLDLYELVKSHLEGLGKNTAGFLKELKKMKAQLDKKLDEIEQEEEEEDETPDEEETPSGGEDEETGDELDTGEPGEEIDEEGEGEGAGEDEGLDDF